MDFITATEEFERWLGDQTPLDPDDLNYKHESMADRDTPFPFLRATFYRWLQLFPAVGPKLAEAPVSLAVGDLHIENFGTWRDAEGRLAWGINDFDEAAKLPFTNDLVRLGTSGALMHAMGVIRLRVSDVAEAILLGYADSLKAGGVPFVLSENHAWLRDIATSSLRDPVRFWEKFQKKMRSTSRPTPDV